GTPKAAAAPAGAPVTRDGDAARRRREAWPVTDADLLALAGGGELVVADGNRRSLAAQPAGLPRFLAVVTTSAPVAIEPYNRLVSEVPADLGLDLTPLEGTPTAPSQGGVVHLYSTAGAWAVRLPR